MNPSPLTGEGWVRVKRQDSVYTAEVVRDAFFSRGLSRCAVRKYGLFIDALLFGLALSFFAIVTLLILIAACKCDCGCQKD